MQGQIGKRVRLTVLCAALALAAFATPVQAAPGDPLFIFQASQSGAPGGEFEGPCGLAVNADGNFYVSDYYHHAIDIFSSSRSFVEQLTKEDPLDGPCGLAVDSVNSLYVNNYHRNVVKFTPSAFTAGGPGAVFDANHPTGVAVDPTSGNVYVNDRTRIAVYDSTGAAVQSEGSPLEIGLGNLVNGYGVAYSQFPATAGRLYVPDAATNTIKVYNPATSKVTPVQTIAGPGPGFSSLRDSAVAVDRLTGKIYVADNLQPASTERPEAVIYVFSSAGTFLGHLKYGVVDALPPGLAVDNSAVSTQGRVYVTSGNSEKASVIAYAPGAEISGGLPAPAPASAGGGSSASSPQEGADRVIAGDARVSAPGASASSTISQQNTLRVTVDGKLAPKKLPRKGQAPIAVSVNWQIGTTDETPPPQLKTLSIEVNRNGHFDSTGLPLCPYAKIQPATSARALSNCRDALVGEGTFSAEISLSSQEPYSTQGRLLVFNGQSHGKPVLFGQIYSPHPFATSFVIPFQVKNAPHGQYGTTLSTTLPATLLNWGNLTGIDMTLSRRYGFEGTKRSYISAGCPAPKGFGSAVFPLARTSFGFAGGQKLSTVFSSVCKARG
jgi:hypothetical protein